MKRSLLLCVSLELGSLVAAPASDAGAITVSIKGDHASEGQALRFDVTLSRAARRLVAVNYATVEDTADDSSDFVARAGTLRFQPGRTRRTIAIAVNTDRTDEPEETMWIALSHPRRAALAKRDVASGTISDIDGPPSIGVRDTAADERDGTIAFGLTLSEPSGYEISVAHDVIDGTATTGVDHDGSSGTTTFPPGSTTRTVSVSVIDDEEVEDDETLAVRLRDPVHATIGDGEAIGTIVDDDVRIPAVSVGDASGTEGRSGESASMTFPVTLSMPAPATVAVDYSVVAHTASSGGSGMAGGNDFTAGDGTVRFAAGSSAATITVPVHGDDVDEDDVETFRVVLRPSEGSTIADGEGIGSIADDDPTPSVSIDDVLGNEPTSGTNTFTFLVALSSPSGRPISVAYGTADGTARGPGDYAPVSGVLLIQPGATGATIDVEVMADNRTEDREVFEVRLSDPQNVVLGRATALGKIRAN